MQYKEIESSDEHEKSKPSSLSQKVIFYVHRPWISFQRYPLSTVGSVQNMRLCSQPQICKRKHSKFARYILYKSTQAKAATVKGSSQRFHTLTGGKSLAPALQNSYLDSHVFTTLTFSQWIWVFLRFIWLYYFDFICHKIVCFWYNSKTIPKHTKKFK